MSAPKRVELTFLGQALALRTDASPDYVRKLAKFVEERVADVVGREGPAEGALARRARHHRRVVQGARREDARGRGRRRTPRGARRPPRRGDPEGTLLALEGLGGHVGSPSRTGRGGR